MRFIKRDREEFKTILKLEAPESRKREVYCIVFRLLTSEHGKLLLSFVKKRVNYRSPNSSYTPFHREKPTIWLEIWISIKAGVFQ